MVEGGVWLKKFPEKSVIKKAFEFASEAHKGALRLSGEPYMTHPLAVAKTVHEWGLDEASIAAALLHDTVEDSGVSRKEIEKRFGEEIAFLVEGLTKITRLSYPKQDPDAESIRKLILSFSKDLRVILVKLADRLHNMNTLEFMPPEKQREISWETVEIYAPIAYRLGMQRVSGDLEDLAFPYLYPQEHGWLMAHVGEEHKNLVRYAEHVKPLITKALRADGVVPLEVDSRAKRHYSLWKKLLRNEMDLERIYDLVAFRIIVKSVEDCYAALGIVHKHWQPLPGRFKDYISHPKSNGYRSLHTTVFCVNGRVTEIQIKTKEMHEENEFGVAAHWAYSQVKRTEKGAKNWKGVVGRKELLWVEQLREWQKKFSAQDDFLDSLKVDFFKDRVFAVTPQNDIIDLPEGATPVDFAYQIHRVIGDHCVGAKVNGKIVPLDREIRSGDVVQILTQRNKKPSEDWLRFVKTAIARKYIRGAVRRKLVGFRKPEELLEFRIVASDRAGYLKEVTAVFGDMGVNVLSLTANTEKRRALGFTHAKCPLLPKQKIERILTRLKSIPGTREVSAKKVFQ